MYWLIDVKDIFLYLELLLIDLYSFENWGTRLAPLRPYFLSSFIYAYEEITRPYCQKIINEIAQSIKSVNDIKI